MSEDALPESRAWDKDRGSLDLGPKYTPMAKPTMKDMVDGGLGGHFDLSPKDSTSPLPTDEEKKSDDYYQASKEGSDLIPFGQPILVGHHSEGRHRALIDRNHRRMGKCVEYSQKAEDHILKAENLEYKLKRELPIDTPDCLEEIREQLSDAKKVHKFYKENKEAREHAFSLTYANKKVKDLTKRLEILSSIRININSKPFLNIFPSLI